MTAADELAQAARDYEANQATPAPTRRVRPGPRIRSDQT